MDKFHEILKNIRLQAGYSQTHFAKLLNVSRRAYQYYEAGTKMPSVEKLNEIALALGVSVDHLLGRDDIPLVEQIMKNFIVENFDTLDFSSDSQRFDIAIKSFKSSFSDNPEALQDLSSLILAISLYKINKKHENTSLTVDYFDKESVELLEKLKSLD